MVSSGNGFWLEDKELQALQTICSTDASSITEHAILPHISERLHEFFTRYFQFHLDRAITFRTGQYLY
jgi:hypothetical protein